MLLSLGHLGPSGTNAETVALAYAKWLDQTMNIEAVLHPYQSIGQTIEAVAEGRSPLAIVPVENSIEGGVNITLDSLWQFDHLRIQHALVLPIVHALISLANNLTEIKTIYSHPQALAQCQNWLADHLPGVELVAANSTAEGVKQVETNKTVGAIASPRAAEIYQLPILAQPINDYLDNFTRFWVFSQDSFEWHFGQVDQSHLLPAKTHTSLAFSLAANIPGALVKSLQVLADHQINMSRIESRPTKRSLGEYLFFIDLEADATQARVKSILDEFKTYTETLKIFGSYSVIAID